MAKTSISADVKAANSKLAIHLRRKEEEEMLLQIGKRKPRAADNERVPTGRAKWHIDPDFKVPSCQVDRPRTLTGATSFHFSYLSISKQSIPTDGGMPLPGPYSKTNQPALEHSKYIEREGAAEKSAGAQHAAYIERDGAVESVSIDPSALASEIVERSIAHVINESPTESEAELLGVKDVASADIPSVFTNISQNPFERQEYWRAVERCERTPKVHNLVLDPETSPRWWAALESAENLNDGFRNHALLVMSEYRHYHERREAALKDGNDIKPFSPKPWIVSAESAGRILRKAMAMPGFDHSHPPIEFKSGRGGRVQIRFVAELPHELSPEGRALIAQNFCEKLASLERRTGPDGVEQNVGMMYTAVIHAPDAHNDERNYHLHVVAHDRPAKYLEDQSAWDFEIQEFFMREGSGSMRVRYPHRQNKIGEVSQSEFNTGKANSGKDFVPAMRREFAKITNSVLKSQGIERRYDPRKYTEMGIDRTPTQHLGTKAAALESIGVPTVVGQLNAIAIWSDAERSIEKQAKQSDKSYVQSQDKLVVLSQQATAAVPNHSDLVTLRNLISQRKLVMADLAEDRRAVMAFDCLEAKAKSRAIRTRQTCQQLLADIETGKANGTTRVMRKAIEARWKAAQAHIAKIDEDLAPHRQSLRDAATDIERREMQIKQIDEKLKPIVMSLNQAVQNAPKPRTYSKNTSAKTKDSGQAPSTPSNENSVTPPAPVSSGKEQSVPQDEAASMAPSNDNSFAKPENASTTAHDQQNEKPASDQSIRREGHSEHADKLLPQTEPGLSNENGSERERQNASEPDQTKQADQEEEKLTVLEPVSIAGRPIVNPTLDPKPVYNPEEGKEPDQRDGEIIEPLRAIPAEPETPAVSVSLDENDEINVQGAHAVSRSSPKADGTNNDKNASNDQADIDASKASARDNERAEKAAISSADDSDEPKVDRRKKVQDPTLFDLPTQPAPTKPGSSQAGYEDWDAVINRIAKERIPIRSDGLDDGSIRFTVPDLSADETKLINSQRFAKRSSARLKSIHETQDREVKRLIRWFKQNISDESRIAFTGKNSIRFQPGAPKAIITLMHAWGRKKEVRDMIVAEQRRRDKVEASASQHREKIDRNVAALQARGDTRSREDMLADAASRYPKPDQVGHALVANFTKLLLDLAPTAELQEAAKRIAKNPVAREAVHHSTHHLATAYTIHSGEAEGQYHERVKRERDGK